MKRSCEWCSREVAMRPKQRFCSLSCSSKRRRKPRPLRKCEGCGKFFSVSPDWSRQRFCSHPCASRASSQPLEQRLEALVEKVAGGCWEWRGSKSEGYGKIAMGHARPKFAHRVVYEHFVGPIPTDYEVDHLCRNRGCVNPEHLEAVTRSENRKRAHAPVRLLARTCPLCLRVCDDRPAVAAHLVDDHGARHLVREAGEEQAA